MGKNQKRKKRTGIPKDETPEQRTKRLTEFRVNRACHDIESIASLGGSPYTLTVEQKADVIKSLLKAVEIVNTAFRTGTTAQAGFELKT